MVKNKWGIELKPQTICSIDASTNSLAFALFAGEDLGTVGKINFEGNDTYEVSPNCHTHAKTKRLSAPVAPVSYP